MTTYRNLIISEGKSLLELLILWVYSSWAALKQLFFFKKKPTDQADESIVRRRTKTSSSNPTILPRSAHKLTRCLFKFYLVKYKWHVYFSWKFVKYKWSFFIFKILGLQRVSGFCLQRRWEAGGKDKDKK